MVPASAKGKRSRRGGSQLGEEVVRGRVLLGAAGVFAEKGLRAASVEDILGAANVSRRTFYRVFKNKEDVAMALYRVGTDALLERFRSAIATESDPLRQLELCIDIHLSNAKSFGRVIFVLGGEAQRRESPLHARRMEVHDTLVEIIDAAQLAAAGSRVDPYLLRTLILSLEGVTRMALEEGDEGRRVTDAQLERARRVMNRIATAAIAGDGPRVAPLPTID